MHRFLMALALLIPASSAGAQDRDSGLVAAAEQARSAWFAHDAAGLVADSPRLLIQLPGADPSAVGVARQWWKKRSFADVHGQDRLRALAREAHGPKRPKCRASGVRVEGEGGLKTA